MTKGTAEKSQAEAVRFDATCTPDVWLSGYGDWLAGGFAGCALSAGGRSSSAALSSVASAYRLIRADPRLRLARTAEDIRLAREAEDLAILLHFQSTAPFEHDVDLVEVFARLGVRIVGLAYNRRGLVCDGCEEPLRRRAESIRAPGRRGDEPTPPARRSLPHGPALVSRCAGGL